MKILIIEDEILIQQSLKKLLEKKGAEVSCCANGKNAIEMILMHDYDRIVCDLMLQDISGFDVIEESKKKFPLEIIAQKFIIITAYCSEQVLEKANNYGCKVLNKPFDNMNEALETIMTIK
jgi:CheY-like chemotaxis protein